MTVDSSSWEGRSLSSRLHGFSHIETLETDGPLIVERGEGSYIYDIHGNRYLEANSGLWNAVAGFDSEELIETACRQYRKFPSYHTFFTRDTAEGVVLAERLLELAPVPMSKVFYTNSGSEANDTVVKILWMINLAEGKPARRKLISRLGAYHGTTVMGSSLTGKDYNAAFGLPLDCVCFADCPHYWRYGKTNESESQYVERLAANLEELIEREGAENIAGMFAEPVMGAGGVVPPPTGYFSAVQGILRKYEIPLIADEVICGFGRTGNLWGSQTYDIKPDIIVASKCLTGGYFPMGAVLVSEEMNERVRNASVEFDEFPHGFTAAGNPVGCAIAMKALDLIVDGGLFDNLVAVAPHFQQRLHALNEHPIIGEARGVGLMGALELVHDKETKSEFPKSMEIGEQVAKETLRNGLIVRPLGDSIILAPPFIVSKNEIDELFDQLEKTLTSIAQNNQIT